MVISYAFYFFLRNKESGLKIRTYVLIMPVTIRYENDAKKIFNIVSDRIYRPT
jgi:hypothetical protein